MVTTQPADNNQWPTEEQLFRRWWAIGPGKTRSDEFWTPTQVAKRTQYSETRIRGLCDEGKLPYFKYLGRLYIHIPSLLRAGASFVRPVA